MRTIAPWIAILITACNGGDPVTSEPPAGLSYANNPGVYTVGVAIPPNSPSSSGGAVQVYSVAPALPSGLFLNPVSGVIDGNPTSITPLRAHTVFAANAAGSTSVVLSIAVNDRAPDALSYSTNPTAYVVGVPIIPNVPTSSGGAVVSYTVAPDLPTGLTLDGNSGVISGTPQAIANSTHNVTATNSGGSTSTQLTLRVNPPPGPVIVAQPADQMVPPGTSASFTVEATGWGPLTYAWRKDGAVVPGASAASYTTPPTSAADSGSRFDVVVGDGFGGSVSSAAATMIVEGFVATGYMQARRAAHAATLLEDGRVLIAGGYNTYTITTGFPLSVETYEPVAGTFNDGPAVSGGRIFLTATRLVNGKVLLAGGGIGNPGVASAELFDPVSGTLHPVGEMIASRRRHSATLLVDGKVLLVGGEDLQGDGHATAELFDPASETFAPTGSMATPRTGHTATLLADGRVLVAGGTSRYDRTSEPTPLDSAEVYDPTTGVFTATPSMGTARYFHTATRLGDGTVLLAGGRTSQSQSLASTERFDPARNTFTLSGSMSTSRFWHSATLLPNGRVLVVGGGSVSVWPYWVALSTAELYDPESGGFIRTGALVTAQSSFWHTATRLPDGRVLIAGGTDVTSSYVGTAAAQFFVSRP